jgi:hypothetical protein
LTPLRQYLNLCKKYYGGQVDTILERMATPAHRNKKVLYLHYLGLLGDRAAQDSVQRHAASKDDLIAEVALKASRHIAETINRSSTANR